MRLITIDTKEIEKNLEDSRPNSPYCGVISILFHLQSKAKDYTKNFSFAVIHRKFKESAHSHLNFQDILQFMSSTSL